MSEVKVGEKYETVRGVAVVITAVGKYLFLAKPLDYESEESHVLGAASKWTKTHEADGSPVVVETGRPKANEPYRKVTVPLYIRQVILLDTAALAYKRGTGQHVSRADLLRGLIDRAAPSLDPGGGSFYKYTMDLLSQKEH